MSLLLSDFDFELPERLIARYPARPRDAARLLVVRPDGLEDRQVSELPAILRPGDLMVFNDTKVIPAQLQGRRARPGSPEVAMEVTLHKRAGDDRWLAFAKPGRRLAPGDRIQFGEDLAAEVLEKSPAGDILLGFNRGGADLMAALHRLGAMPLPPYIRKLRPVEAGGCGGLPDRLCRARGRGGGPHRRAPFHARPAGATDVRVASSGPL